MKKVYILSAVVFCLLVNHSSAQTWVADSTFGVNSVLTVQPGTSTSSPTPTNFLIQQDGKIICAGRDMDCAIGNCDQHNDMVRFNICDGSLDKTFGTNGIVHHNFDFRNGAEDYVLQSDGKIISTGTQNSSNAASTERAFVARYKTDGTPDTSWNHTATTIQSLTAGSSNGFSVMLTPNNRIICTAVGGGIGDMRFLSNGSLDTTFNHTGQCVAAIPFVFRGRGHLLQNGKTINVFPYSTGNQYTFGAVAFDSTGTRDFTFGNGGLFNYTLNVGNGPLISAIQPDEKIILAMRDLNQERIYVLRLKPNGVLDSTFGTNGSAFIGDVGHPVNAVGTITVLRNGKILIEGSGSSSNVGFIARLNSNGTLDAAFENGGYLNSNDIRFISSSVELSNGDLLIAGVSIASNTNEMIVRYALQGNLPRKPQISKTGNQLISTGSGAFQWFLNGNPVGINSNSHTPLTNGTYTVQVTDIFGCSYLSNPFIGTDGINEIANTEGISIYPNPAKGEFTIHNTRNTITSVEIFDLLGEKVYFDKIINSTSCIIHQKFSVGIYFVKVSDREKQYNMKLTVQHD